MFLQITIFTNIINYEITHVEYYCEYYKLLIEFPVVLICRGCLIYFSQIIMLLIVLPNVGGGNNLYIFTLYNIVRNHYRYQSEFQKITHLSSAVTHF